MEYWVYTGGYTEAILQGTGDTVQGKCPGICCYLLRENGELLLKNITRDISNPSYLTIAEQGDRLFCVQELKEWKGFPSSAVSSFTVHDNCTLEYNNSEATGGTDGCFVSLAAGGRYLLAANYSSGSLAVFPVDKAGNVESASCFFQHKGSSVDPLRQEGPHVHFAMEYPGEDIVWAVDLGQDKIFCYRADWNNGWLIPEPSMTIQLEPGQGPRHMCWNKENSFLYILTELSAEILVYQYEKNKTPKFIQKVYAHPDTIKEHSGAAIRMHPSGSYLYVSLRTTNSVSAFQIREDGTLLRIQNISCGGTNPRDINLTPHGEYLLSCNQDSGNLVVFSVDNSNGQLTQVSEAAAPFITCAVMAKVK